MPPSFVKLPSGKIVNLEQIVLVEPNVPDNYLGMCVRVTASYDLSFNLSGADGDALLEAIGAGTAVLDPD
jgi:hypothetical protein